MKPLFAALLSSLTALPAPAQTPDSCGAGVQNYIPQLPAPGTAYVTVATDPKGLAPVKPAIVVNVLLPAGSLPFVTDGVFSLQGEHGAVPLATAGADYSILGAGPRAPARQPDATILAPRHASFETRYKVYVAVPPEAPAQFTVSFPRWVSLHRVLSVPPLAFRRAAGGETLDICSVLPG
jgi:hypothetical protein